MSIDAHGDDSTKPHSGKRRLHLTPRKLSGRPPPEVSQCLRSRLPDHEPRRFPGGAAESFMYLLLNHRPSQNLGFKRRFSS